jgi:hypothetical protein
MTKTKDKTRKLVQFFILHATSSAAEANYRTQQTKNKKNKK